MSETCQPVTKALRDTADEIIAWSLSDKNNGPWEQEAHRICVHIAGALNIAADKIETSHDQ